MRGESIHTAAKLGKFPPEIPMDAFTKVARHYETLMEGVPYAMWVSYLKLVWAKVGLKPQEVLEVACGTGRLCRMLTGDGYRMTGVDVSVPMIEEARAMARSAGMEIRFEAQDAALMKLGCRFDAAFSFFDSLNNITDANAFFEALKRVREHLNPGGAFLFDLNTAYAFEKKMFDQKELRESEPIRYEWFSDWNPETRLCTIKMEFWTNDEKFSETHVQRAYSVSELETMMRAAGFSEVEFFDAYTLNRPHEKSDRIHVLGR